MAKKLRTSPRGLISLLEIWENKEWRTGWDSNPRYAFTHTRVPGVRLKPLGHLSVFRLHVLEICKSLERRDIYR